MRTIALVFAMSLVTTAARAENVLRDSDVYDRWLRSSPEVASWRLQVGSARFDVVTAGLIPNPNMQFGITQLVSGNNTGSKTQYTGQLTIPLPIFGQIGKRVDAAEAFVTVTEVSVRQSVWLRAGDLQASMLDRAYAAARVEQYEKNVSELSRIEGIVKTRTAAGANPEYDLLRVKTASATMQASLDSARIARDRAEATLVSLVGDNAPAPIARQGLASFVGPEDEAQLVSIALTRRPDLELASRSAQANEALASSWRRNAVPVPSIFVAGTVGQGADNFFFTGGISIDLPTFTRNQGAIGRAVNDAEGQRTLGRALDKRIRAEVSGAWRARQTARQALDAFRTNGLVSADGLLTRAELMYQAGTMRIAELFDAYQTVWEARSQAIDLERQMAEAEAAVEHACVLLPLASDIAKIP
jgi:cobalt-zinc-cadmium efflux system outer membrane protein